MIAIIIVAVIAIIYPPTRKLIIKNARVVISASVLFVMGYCIGDWFSKAGGPFWLKWLAGVVFVIAGLPEVLNYINQIFPPNRK